MEPQSENTSERQQSAFVQEIPVPMEMTLSKYKSSFWNVVQAGEWMVLSSLSQTVRLARHVIFTMY